MDPLKLGPRCGGEKDCELLEPPGRILHELDLPPGVHEAR